MGAKGFCEQKGARLCTSQELVDGEVKGAGCDFDPRHVWSSTPCCDGNGPDTCAVTGFRWAVLGGGRDLERPWRPVQKCMSDSSSDGAKLNVRCCLDQVKAGAKCPECPANSETTGPGALDITECKCKEGFYGPNGGECLEVTDAPTAAPTLTLPSCVDGEYLQGSSKSCGQLNWPTLKGVKNQNNAKVCVRSGAPGGDCEARKTFSEAKAMCEKIGARLCRNKEELHSAVYGRDDTCGILKPKKQFWIDRPCSHDSKWAVGGKQAFNYRESCRFSGNDVDPGVIAFVACCADEPGDSAQSKHCATCPGDSTSTGNNLVGLDSCTCPSPLGYNKESSSARAVDFCTTTLSPTKAPTKSPVPPTMEPTWSPTPPTVPVNPDCRNFNKALCNNEYADCCVMKTNGCRNRDRCVAGEPSS